MSSIEAIVSCLDGYDPDALRVDKAVEAVRACLSPITQTERLRIRWSSPFPAIRRSCPWIWFCG